MQTIKNSEKYIRYLNVTQLYHFRTQNPFLGAVGWWVWWWWQ